MGLRAGSARARMSRARRAVVLVTAVATFGVVAVNGAPAAGASTEKIERAQLRDLLSSVPQSYRAGCASYDPNLDPALTALSSHIVAMVRCKPSDGADWVFYSRFDDQTSLEAAYHAYVKSPQGDGSDSCPGTGTWDQDDEEAGLWACYLADGAAGQAPKVATVVWTHTDTLTLSAAYRNDDDLTAIDDWWNSADAGPLAETDARGLPKTLTTTQWLANGKALKAVVPADQRSSCTPAALTETGIGVPFYKRRTFLLGALRCRQADLESVYYFRFAPGVGDVTPTQGVFDSYSADATGDVQEKVGPFTCDGTGNWGRRKTTVGQYSCIHDHDDTGDFVNMVWTDDDQDILGYAAVAGTDATPLLTFFKDDAGPLEAS